MPKITEIPPWLFNLSIGEYTLTELTDMSGVSKSALQRKLKRLGVAKKYEKNVKNFCRVSYLWSLEKATEYLKETLDKRSALNYKKTR